MRIKGNLEKIKIRFEDSSNLEIKDVKGFSCSEIQEVLNINNEFNEYDAGFICLTLDEKENKFINQGNLKGTLFSVLKKNAITWFEVYTDKEKYKIYAVQKMTDTENMIEDGLYLTEKPGWGDSFNLAQTTSIDEEGNLILVIAQEVVDTYFDEEEWDYE